MNKTLNTSIIIDTFGVVSESVVLEDRFSTEDMNTLIDTYFREVALRVKEAYEQKTSNRA